MIVTPQKPVVKIVELDKTKVKFLGGMNVVLIKVASNPKFCQIIDILFVDVLEFYGLILRRDWSKELHSYFATIWSHPWLPYNGKPNQIHVDMENHMKYYGTDLDEENEPVVFKNNILGNYSLESFFGDFEAQSSPSPVNFDLSQI